MRGSIAAIALMGIIIISGCGDDISRERLESGKKVYQSFCQTCHMEDGGGVPNMNASLVGSKYIAGDKTKLIKIVLHGSPEFAGDTERRYQNKMPPLGSLNDIQIADVLTYIRNSFSNKASSISIDDVKASRN